MDKIDLDYAIQRLNMIVDTARLGVDSQNNMEQVIFRRIYNDVSDLRNCLTIKQRIFAKTESDNQ